MPGILHALGLSVRKGFRFIKISSEMTRLNPNGYAKVDDGLQLIEIG